MFLNLPPESIPFKKKMVIEKKMCIEKIEENFPMNFAEWWRGKKTPIICHFVLLAKKS